MAKGHSMPRAGSSGLQAIPAMPGNHSWSKQYRYWVPASLVAWNPLPTPRGTSTWEPGTSVVVTTAPWVAEVGLRST